MPPVVAAVVSAAVTTGMAYAAGAFAVGGALAGFTFMGMTAATAFFAASFVASAALGIVSTALAPDMPKPSLASMQGRDQMIRQTNAPRRLVYGRVKVAGPVAFMQTTSASEYLHIVTVLGTHDFEEIETVYFNEDALTLSGGGLKKVIAPQRYDSTTTDFANIQTRKSAAEPAFTALIEQSNGLWTTSHKLTNCPAIYARLKYDGEVYTNGIPNISAIVKGRRIYDPRTATTYYTANAALVLRDYLTDQQFGLACTPEEIDEASFITAANICDENVPLSGGGTEKRYECHGIVTTDNTPSQIIHDILSAMGGILTYTNGKFQLKASAYITPTETLTEDHFVGTITINTKPSRKDGFNAVKGQFVTEDANWKVVDYPPITSSVFEAEDGGERVFTELDLPYTTSPSMAQRLAKIALYRQRQEITITSQMRLDVFKYNVGDTVMITLDRYGFTNKVFEIISWGLNLGGGDNPALAIDVTLRETNSQVFDWDAEETAFAIDNTDLRSPYDVLPPSISVSEELRLINESVTNVLLVDLATSDNMALEFVVSYKKSTDAEYRQLARGKNTRHEIIGVTDDQAYNIQARSITGAGNYSAPTVITYRPIGQSAPPQDVTNFSVNIIGKEAHLSWTPVTDIDLSHYVVRHSSATSGATWSSSAIVADKISRPANTIVVPALTGTYLIKSVDKKGIRSINAAASVCIIQTLRDANLIAVSTQNPAFSGTKTNVVAVDNALILDTSVLFDDTTGDFDDALGLFDGGFGSVYSKGTYYFDSIIDLGSRYTSKVRINLNVDTLDYVNSFDSATGNFDSREGLFDGNSQTTEAGVRIFVATTDDDPSGTPTWTDFRQFIVGDYSCRAYKFKAVLDSDSGQVTPQISKLQVVVDMPDRFYSEGDISSGAAPKAVTFPNAFKVLDSVAITAQDLNSGDYFTVTGKSATGFTVTFYNSSATMVDRTFDYTAKGYGELIT